MIRQNIIQNFPVVIEYIDIDGRIFGPGISNLKGRTTRQRSKVVVEIFIEIPRGLIKNNHKLILCMDIMFINQQALFVTIYKDVRFSELVPLVNITKEEYYRALDVVTRHYKKIVFLVKALNVIVSLKQLWMK